jgi:hypothetical protein
MMVVGGYRNQAPGNEAASGFLDSAVILTDKIETAGIIVVNVVPIT